MRSVGALAKKRLNHGSMFQHFRAIVCCLWRRPGGAARQARDQHWNGFADGAIPDQLEQAGAIAESNRRRHRKLRLWRGVPLPETRCRLFFVRRSHCCRVRSSYSTRSKSKLRESTVLEQTLAFGVLYSNRTVPQQGSRLDVSKEAFG